MKLDTDRNYATHRDNAGARWFIQDGQRFTPAGVHLGPVGKPDIKPDAVESQQSNENKEAIRERASKKLEGFAEAETTGPIAAALNENKQAAAAEENAE
jgi:hypothetical protein